MTIKIIAFTGSLSPISLNQKLIETAIKVFNHENLIIDVLDQQDLDLPLYSQTQEKIGFPQKILDLKQRFISANGFLISSPEHNASYSAALKNLIDWLSRPAEGEGRLACFSGKVAALMAASPGALGGLRGLNHLRILLNTLGVLVIPEQLAVNVKEDTFTDDGKLIINSQQQALENLVNKMFNLTKKISGNL